MTVMREHMYAPDTTLSIALPQIDDSHDGRMDGPDLY